MKRTLRSVLLKEIKIADEFFRHSDDRYDPDGLLDSLGRYGLLNPVFVIPHQAFLRPVTGFRRIAAARRLRIQTAPAYVLDTDTPTAECFRLSIWENMVGRELNLFEKATALERLRSANVSKKDIRDQFVPLLRLAQSQAIEDDLRHVAHFPTTLVDYIVAKQLSPRHLRHLKNLPGSSLLFLGKMAARTSPAANIFVELSKGLVHLAKRDGQRIEDVASALGFGERFFANNTHSLNFQTVRDTVEQHRFPTLARINQELRSELRLLKPPPFVAVEWDKTFEKTEITIKLRIKNEQQLNKGLDELRTPEWKQAIKHILQNL